jgi:hypothetical protein
MDYEKDPGWKYLRLTLDEMAEVGGCKNQIKKLNQFIGTIEAVRLEERLLGAGCG